jgi:Neuraminidase (sialidase)
MDPTRSSVNLSYTTDGGKTWTQSRPQGTDACGGNHAQAWEASGDVWVSFGPDGTVFFTTLAWAHFETQPTSDYVSVVYTSTSRDGGKTWSHATLVSPADATADKDMIVADPTHPGTVYIVWDNAGFGLVPPPRGANQLMFSKSTDFGATWTNTVVAAFPPDQPASDSQLSVLKNGTLVDTAVQGSTIWAYRSANGGQTWSSASLVAHLSSGSGPALCGTTYRGGGTFGADAVVGPHSVALVINDGAAAATGKGELILARSDDGGVTWATRPILQSPHLLLLASVGGTQNGKMGLVYDEINAAQVSCTGKAGHGVIPTRIQVALSTNRGRTWSAPATVGASWWNTASTLVPPQYFAGDYQTIVADPGPNGGFVSVTVQGRPLPGGSQGPHLTGATGVIVASEWRY